MHHRILATALVAAGFLLPVTASADPGLDTLFPTDTISTPVLADGAMPMPEIELPVIESVTLQASDGPAFGPVVDAARLDGMRGGDGNLSTTTNSATLRGGVNGNTATNVVGGGNRVSDGSFGNSAGISTVIQNSGSNVLIQNSTIVNVQFVPTP